MSGSATEHPAPLPPPLPSQLGRLPRPPRRPERPVVDPAANEPAADTVTSTSAVAAQVAPGEAAAPVDDPAPSQASVTATSPGGAAADPSADAAPAEAPSPGGAAAGLSAETAPPGETTDAWGRVDEDGTVYVRTAGGERAVGSWQVGEPAKALDYYRRKYDALVVEVSLLERRVRSGALPSDEATASVRRTQENLDDAQVVGDLPALAARLDKLLEVIEARRAKRKAERAKALEAARRTKESLVAESETIAAGSDWRAGADRLRAMLDQWKTLPRLEKRVDDELWHRFSAARTTYTRRRKSHFAELADKRDDAKVVKEKLVVDAEGLATSTEWGATAARYRELMTQWKAAGPAPRKEEESLWQRFRAAQDAFFLARTAVLSERDSAEQTSVQAKEQLLIEAEALLPVKDLAATKSALRSIQDRWTAAGRVPREAITRLESRLRKVEETVRAGEQAEWTRTSPEALARAEATVTQLHTSIDKLEKQLAAAESAGNSRGAADAHAALHTRRAWLSEAEKTLAEFRR